jgi:hypothetical protein
MVYRIRHCSVYFGMVHFYKPNHGVGYASKGNKWHVPYSKERKIMNMPSIVLSITRKLLQQRASLFETYISKFSTGTTPPTPPRFSSIECGLHILFKRSWLHDVIHLIGLTVKIKCFLLYKHKCYIEFLATEKIVFKHTEKIRYFYVWKYHFCKPIKKRVGNMFDQSENLL